MNIALYTSLLWWGRNISLRKYIMQKHLII